MTLVTVPSIVPHCGMPRRGLMAPSESLAALRAEGKERRRQARAEALRVRQEAAKLRNEKQREVKHTLNQTADRKQRYLDALKAGATKREARLQAVGNHGTRIVPLSEPTVRKWRERDIEFRRAESALYSPGGDQEGFDPLDLTFASFRKQFFGYDTPPHQKAIVAALKKAIQSHQRTITLILCPPEAGKTSTIEDWICEQIKNNPNVRIGIVSSTPTHGRKIIGKLKKRLTTDTSAYVQRWGPFYEGGQEKLGRPWASDHFTILGNASDERDYTLSAFGWDGSMIGTRWDLVICDDIQPFKLLSQTDKILNTFKQDIYTRVGADCPIVFIGNRVGMGDIYEEMLATPAFIDHLVTVPALDDNGESFWPEKWPTEALLRTKVVVGEDVWWRNYMQNPKASGKGSFSELLVERALDKTQDHNKPATATGVVVGVDPAISGGCAVIACAYNQQRLVVLDLAYHFDLGSNEAIINAANLMATTYQAKTVVIEQNAMQKGIVRDERFDQLASYGNYRIQSHQTGILKTDPVWGVPAMADSMRRGELVLAWGPLYCQERLQPLVDQLTRWRPDIPTKNLRQDCVMALWFAHKWWKENRNVEAQGENWNTGHALPWAAHQYAKTG